jgi:hypothetical protein
VAEDTRRNQRTDPNSDKERNIQQTGEQRTIQQVTGIRNEDLLQNLQARGPCGVEDLSLRICLHVLGTGHLNVPDDIDEDADAECFETAEDVCNLGHGRFDHSLSPSALITVPEIESTTHH